MTGVFCLPKAGALAMKFLQPPSRNSQAAYLFVDGVQVLGGQINSQSLMKIGRVELAKGIHQLEVLAKDAANDSHVIVGYETNDGTFEPMPAAWFSAEQCPEIAAFLKPKATLAVEGDALVATMLQQPQRLRKLRLVLNDFAGTGVTVKSVTVKNDQGQTIVPVAEDFSSGKKTRCSRSLPATAST